MNYWLLKTDPETFSWETFYKEGTTTWDGVRNYRARNFLRLMKKGEQVLIYESNESKSIKGTAVITSEHFSDSTAINGDWSAVKLKAVKSLKRSVSLTEIRADIFLKNLMIVKNSRLSVMPLSKEEYHYLISKSEQD